MTARVVTRRWRRLAPAAKWIAALLLFAIGFLGARSGISDLRVSVTPGQAIASTLSIAYGALALVACYAVGMGERWASAVLWGWAITMTVMVAMAPAVWGGAGPGAVVAAGGAAAGIALVVIWLARVGMRADDETGDEERELVPGARDGE